MFEIGYKIHTIYGKVKLLFFTFKCCGVCVQKTGLVLNVGMMLCCKAHIRRNGEQLHQCLVQHYLTFLFIYILREISLPLI